ncbi:hypothetical protein EXT47_02800 [Pseudoalteromonas sp. CO342X]|uniref:hypothetical protein n=1 Tax=Pseudoalteromonas sp. CO342X TaxID=1777270 RepID=UPI001023941A|nr:hypothetical protein [Pseudoalteromonas sp. CO342X]RZG17400.1 hypothetical protein EXT47_02800 [Pseudoalteromonas sp. CO342X]
MHIPAEQIYKEIKSEDAGVWIVPASNQETAILIKLPTSAAKSLIAGSELELFAGIIDNYLCGGVKIFDVPDAPLFICKPQHHKQALESLIKITSLKKSPLFLYNEMDICIASSEISFHHKAKEQLNDYLDLKYELSLSKDIQNANAISDRFLTKMQNQNGSILRFEVTCDQWESSPTSFYGVKNTYTISIDELNEGEVFERAIWASLESVFPLTLTKSPQVQEGKKKRELTDIVASHQYGTFLIESKDLSVFQAGMNRTRERRLKGTQKQALRAISQLTGASKMVRNVRNITSLDNCSVPLVLNQPMHCIALITEIMHEGDWSKVVQALIKANRETGEFFHLLDFKELINLLKLSNGDSRLFDYNLMLRFEKLIKLKSIHISACADSKDLTEDTIKA